MEIELRRMISEYREGENLTTVFDDQCSYMLSMALSAYETERITGKHNHYKSNLKGEIKHLFYIFKYLLMRSHRPTFIPYLKS